MNINDSHQYLNFYSSNCPECTHYNQGEFTCTAFPEQIPIKILQGDSKHLKPLKDQKNKIVFELKK